MQAAEENAAICIPMSLVGQCLICCRLHLLVGYMLYYRLHKLSMADLVTATFYSLLPFLVLLLIILLFIFCLSAQMANKRFIYILTSLTMTDYLAQRLLSSTSVVVVSPNVEMSTRNQVTVSRENSQEDQVDSGTWYAAGAKTWNSSSSVMSRRRLVGRRDLNVRRVNTNGGTYTVQ